LVFIKIPKKVFLKIPNKCFKKVVGTSFTEMFAANNWKPFCFEDFRYIYYPLCNFTEFIQTHIEEEKIAQQ
jgi:hypothetical protein